MPQKSIEFLSSPLVREGKWSGPVRKLWGKAMRFRYQADTHWEDVNGVLFNVERGVFLPASCRSGALMARAMQDLAGQDGVPSRVLDMGTGSGVGAVCAARMGATVDAVDLSAQAVSCARRNADQLADNGRVNVFHGDLFEPLKPIRYDWILFNPPYYEGRPVDESDYAWRSTDVVSRFAEEVDGWLASNGVLILSLSTEGVCSELVEILKDRYSITVLRREVWLAEVMSVLALRIRI